MIKLFFSISSFLLLGLGSLSAQSIYQQEAVSDLYSEAFNQFSNQQYNASQQLFSRYIAKQSRIENNMKLGSAKYYDALISIYLYHADGEQKIKQFIQSYPNHPLAASAYYEIGIFYYREKNYPKAIQYFQQITEEKIDKEKLSEYKFKLAYSYFSRQAFNEALPFFNDVKKSSNPYQKAAYYYTGYIYYKKEDFSNALQNLNVVAQDQSYRSTVAVMKASIFYQQGKYDDLFLFVKENQSSLTASAKKEIQLIVSDAYYQQKNYDQAYQYFTDYANGGASAIDTQTAYRYAYSAMMVGDNETAIENFKVAAAEEDKNAQYASYFLGKLYTKASNYRFAINAFQKASSMDYDVQIKEYSAFQEAKLLFASQRFSEAIQKLDQFLGDFQNSKYSKEAAELLSEAYLNTNAYGLAITFLESIERSSSRLQEAYQKVTFFQAVDYFNNNRYQESVKMFEKSVAEPVSKAYESQAYFWMGEAYSVGFRFEQAITSYALSNEIVSKEESWYLNLQYGFGYALFNTKQYEQALYKFKNYVDAQEEKKYPNDGTLRLADCYYAIKRYSTALKYYNAVLKAGLQTAYVNYQMGLINGIEQKIGKANQYFDQVISSHKNSEYYDNALFQKSLLAFENGNFNEAIDGFSYLLKAAPRSTLKPYALSKRAIAYYNQQKYDAAVTDYKNILNNYLTHSTANGALLGLQEIYNIQSIEGDLDKYIAAYKKANPDDKAVASIEYESAQNLYFNQEYEKAITAFQAYIEEYNGNTYSFDAKYYLADSYYRSGAYEKALKVFEEVVREQKTTFVDRSKLKIANILYELEDFDASKKAFQEYLSDAKNDKEKFNGLNGLLKVAGQESNYQEMERYASMIIDEIEVNENALNLATLKKGLSHYYRGDYNSAKKSFKKTIDQLKDENAAEANYMLALIEYNSENYKESLDLLFSLTNQFANYSEWVGKSFLLIAENYYELGEEFQAIATLNSIIENASDQLLIKTAKMRLEEIEKLKQERQDEETKKQDSILQKENEIILENDSVRDNE